MNFPYYENLMLLCRISIFREIGETEEIIPVQRENLAKMHNAEMAEKSAEVSLVWV